VSLEEKLDFVREVAERYEGEGYQVFREPSSSKLPKSIRQYHPDLLAMRGRERVVVEIKRASGPLALEQLSKLERLVSKIPGWRLDVVWLGDNRPRSSKAGRNLTNTEIRKRLNEIPVGKTKQAREVELLGLWACLEAAIRNRLSGIGETEKAPIPPSSLVRKAISFGLLPQKELEFLDDLARMRNQVAHGYQVRVKLPTSLSRLRKLILQVLAPTQH